MKIWAVITVIALMFGPFISLIQVGSSLIDQEMTVNKYEIILTSSSPILILNDTAFDEQASANGWQGNGSGSDPYIIANLDIDANGTGYGIGISTSYNVIIRNCSIKYATGGGSPLGGISILNGNVTIHNNTISKCGYGIKAGDGCIISNNKLTFNNFAIWAIGDGMTIVENYCSHNPNTGIHYQGSHSLLKGNMIHDNDFGIHVIEGSWNRLESNTMSRNDDHGIKLDYGSHNNTVISNVAYKNDDGIMIDRGSYGNIIVNNSIRMCEEGLYILSGSENKFYGNSMEGCSFYFGTSLASLLPTIYDQTIPLNNTVLGPTGWEPVLYFGGQDNDNTSINDPTLGQIILWDVENISISNVEILGGTAGTIFFNCENISVKNCVFKDHVYEGILTVHCDRVNITDSIFHNSDQGIKFQNCDDVEVESNTFSGNRLGLTANYVNRIDIDSNLFEYGDEGVWFDSFNDQCNIKNNSFYNQAFYSVLSYSPCKISKNLISKYPETEKGPTNGIIIRVDLCEMFSNIIRYCDTGISIQTADRNSVLKNSIHYCNDGIKIHNSMSNMIQDNTIGSSTTSGIYLESTEGTLATNNTIQNGGTNGNAIFISESDSLIFYENKLLDSSIDLYYSDGSDQPMNIIPSNNTVNGKPVHYFEFENLYENTLPATGGEFIFLGVEGGTLKDIEIPVGLIRVLIYDSTGVSLKNVSFGNSWIGAYSVGIKVVLSDDVRITDCSIGGIKVGININTCQNVLIQNVTFSQCLDSGIGVYHSTIEVNNCRFYGCSIGIEVNNDMGSRIMNSLFQEGGEGIIIDHVSKSTSVQYGGFTENHGYGIWVKEGAFVKVYDNSFIYNGRDIQGGGDLRIDTKHNQVFGNYFWDHLIPDENGDGFVDIHYEGYIGENITDGNERSYLPIQMLGSPDKMNSSQYLGSVYIIFNEPDHSDIIDIEGYIVRRLGIGNVTPRSFEIEAGKELFIDDSIASTGNVTYSIHAISSLGEGKPSFITINRITTSPIINFNHADGTTFSSKNITLSWSIDRPWGEIISVEFSLGDGFITLPEVPTSIDLKNMSNGWHEANVKVRDIRGFSTFTSISFLVDWEAPKVHVKELGNWTSLDVRFEWTISDNIEISRVYHELYLHKNTSLYEIDGHHFPADQLVATRSGVILPPDEMQLISCGNLSLYETIKRFNLTDGNYSFILTVTDIAGNIAWDRTSVGVDRTSPIVKSYGPEGENATIDGTIWFEISEILDPDRTNFTIPGLNGTWSVINDTIFEFTPNVPLDHFRIYHPRIVCYDRAGNRLNYQWWFKTRKDPDWKVQISGIITDHYGDPIEGSSFRIEGYQIDVQLEEDGSFSIELGEGDHRFTFTDGTGVEEIRWVNITYDQGPVDMGGITFEEEIDDQVGEDTPYLMFILGITLILITIYYAISAFKRKKGPFDEE